MRTVRAAKLTAEETAAKAAKQAETERLLASLGLAIGDPIRWQKTEGGKWQEGVVRGTNSDGSIDVSTKHGMRSLWAHVLQTKTRGPKGGTVWQPVPVIAIEPESTKH